MSELEPIELRNGSYNSLEELFCEWKEAHIDDTHLNVTFPENPESKSIPDESFFKESFIDDGKFCDKSTDIRILFVARESNVEDAINKGIVPDGEFWMKNVVETKQNNEQEYYFKADATLSPKDKRTQKIAQTNYYHYLKEIKAKIEHENSTNVENLDDCAYMNLNKRGGYGKCTLEKLDKYVEIYQKFILKEIELLNPERIVFLGGGKYVERIKDRIEIKCDVVHHPASYGKYKALDKHNWEQNLN